MPTIRNRYRSPAESFAFVQQRAMNAGSIMYNRGQLSAPLQASQAAQRTSPPQQPFSTWAYNSPAQSAHPLLPRRQPVMLETRTQPPEIPQARPLSTTAQAIRSLGIQNPQGEYLPQPKMPLPVVQHPTNLQTTMPPHAWTQQKGCGEFEFASLESDISDLGQGLLSTDENTPIIDLRRFPHFDTNHSQDAFTSDASRRMSESSFSMSSNGPLADVPAFDELDVSFHQDYEWAGLETAPQNFMSRSNSRSRASPVPNLRASPYTMESDRNKRWSTGMYPSQTPSRPQQLNRYSSFYGSPLNQQTPMSPFDNVANLQTQNFMYPQNAHFHQSGHTSFSSPDQQFPSVSHPLPSQGLFRMLQSNADRLTGCSSHFADLSDPPDLYSSLHEEPSNPPEEDMNPSDPDLIPHEQDLRFNGDLYTPRWVRGHGNKREGWCGLCKPGRWLVLKNSAFWYDKSFTHGVSAATGAAFQGPQETRRTEGNLDVWEGLCGSCGDWIALVSSKKKGTTWFRHAYKCHTHPKVKDGPKRRRETNIATVRARAASISAPPPAAAEGTVSSQASVNDQSQEHPPLKKVHSEPIIVEIKSENDTTPVSTPQLTHTQLSTPSMPNNHTPNSQQPLTSIRNRRFSMHFDQFNMTSAPFRSRLESFNEHHEHAFHDNKESAVQEAKEPTLPQKKDSGFEDGKEADFFHKEMDFESGEEKPFQGSIDKDLPLQNDGNEEMKSFDDSLPQGVSFDDNVNKQLTLGNTGSSTLHPQATLSPIFQHNTSDESPTFHHGSLLQSPTFHHNPSISSPTFHHSYDDQGIDEHNSFFTSSESTFPGNHNHNFTDQTYQRLSEHFSPHEMPRFGSLTQEQHEQFMQVSGHDQQHESFMTTNDDQIPMLSIETDGDHTMNPFDSFADMI
ncbi:putative mannan endo-1-4-beta-mannosidase A [Venturia nashicola]|nr:putative mannan endo-1-4-beta-mannosidase A [Venturia nashicola]